MSTAGLTPRRPPAAPGALMFPPPTGDNGNMITHSHRGPRTPRVTFWGAAQSVTGSIHLVEVGGERILLDCGSSRGERNPSRGRGNAFPFAPADIDAVVLSHAHVDHCGNLPHLVRQGFAGPIYC